MCKCIKPKAINVGEVDKSGIHIPRECFSSEGEWAVEDVPLCETSDLFVQYFVLTDDGLLFPADIQAVNNLATDPAAVSVVADPVSDPVTDPAAMTHSVQSFYTAKAGVHVADGSVAVLCFH